MTGEELTDRYEVPQKILRMYTAWGFAAEKNGQVCYEVEDLERLGRILCMQQLGFSLKEIAHYLRLQEQEKVDTTACLQFLAKKRQQYLGKIHVLENQLAGIDSMRYDLFHVE